MQAAAAAISAAAAAARPWPLQQRLLLSTKAAAAAAAAALSSPKQLYRELLRQIKQLPNRQQRVYYRNYTRQYFANWDSESDPAVIAQLHAKARADAAWVLTKYADPSSVHP